MNSYTILENGYIERITEEGLISIIPNDPANSDYQAYLASLDEQQAALKDK